MRREVHDGLALEEAGLLGEGEEHLGGGLVGGRVADLVAVGYGHRHASISMDYKNYYRTLFVLLSQQQAAGLGQDSTGLDYAFLCGFIWEVR